MPASPPQPDIQEHPVGEKRDASTTADSTSAEDVSAPSQVKPTVAQTSSPAHPNAPKSGLLVMGVLMMGLSAVVGLLVGQSLGSDAGALAEEDGPGGPGGGGPPPAMVILGQATQAELQSRGAVIGRLQSPKRATVASEVEGRVLALAVDEGDRVVAGETVLARIDPVWSELAMQQANSELASAKADLARNTNELEFLQQLRAAGSGNQKELDDAESAVLADEAAVAAAQARVARAEVDLARAEVLAPFDGSVVTKYSEVGQWMERGGPVVAVVKTDMIDAVADVPEAMVNDLRVGTEVEVRLDALDQTIRGTVRAVVPASDNQARTFPVKISLDNEQGTLKPGMSVVVYTPRGDAEPRLTVPRDAVVFESRGAQVWVAVPNQAGEVQPAQPGAPPFMALPVPVRVEFGAGDRFAVTALPGRSQALLHPGAQVVVQGAERLFPTQPLIPSGPPAEAP